MKRTPGQPIPVHGAIFVTDVESFGKPERSDRDKIDIRERLQQFVLDAISEAGLARYGKPAKAPCDTGDGIGLVFPAEMPKTLLIHRLVAGVLHSARPDGGIRPKSVDGAGGSCASEARAGVAEKSRLSCCPRREDVIAGFRQREWTSIQ